MIKLDSGNVLLKRSHRKQLMAWLRRATRVGKKLGDFVLNLTLQRSGNVLVVRASVHDSAGDFECHTRGREMRHVLRDLVQAVMSRLCTQRLSAA